MKKIILIVILFILFIALTCAVKYYAPVTAFDEAIIANVQSVLSFIPLKYPVFADKTGYVIMLFLSALIAVLCFIKSRNWKQILVLLSLPVFVFVFNRLFVKLFIHRPRPDMVLQISWVHPSSYSYVSTHTFLTFCFFGMLIYYLYTRCKNEVLKYTGIILSVLWIFLTGLSRVWIGVHYPTDILGACILGFIVLIIYVELSKYVERI